MVSGTVEFLQFHRMCLNENGTCKSSILSSSVCLSEMTDTYRFIFTHSFFERLAVIPAYHQTGSNCQSNAWIIWVTHFSMYSYQQLFVKKSRIVMKHAIQTYEKTYLFYEITFILCGFWNNVWMNTICVSFLFSVLSVIYLSLYLSHYLSIPLSIPPSIYLSIVINT